MKVTSGPRQAIRSLALILLLVATAIPCRAALENQVKNDPVPYLSMHGEDMVHWQKWNAATLQRAREEKKPLFLSIGFFACYWCHVMQRESFRDAEISTLLNTHFIPVIIDRELEPELDAQMIEFVEHYRGSAGWPLNVIVTPEGYPLLGGVYFPRQELRTLLVRLSQSWSTKAEDLSKLARAAAQPPKSESVTTDNPGSQKLADELVKQSLQIADRVSGGFGEQSKFPMSSQLLALLRLKLVAQDGKLNGFLRDTLASMARYGLRDHLSGGFFRYTTDPNWRTPHFEKMLYDQAQLARVYLRGAKKFGVREYETIARETLDFALGTMRTSNGLFVSSLSAVDERGDEGAYYIFDRATLASLLDSNELAAVRKYYSLSDAPAFEHGDLLIPQLAIADVAKALDRDEATTKSLLDSALMKLRNDRSRRSLPVDTKQIAAWNGLMLAALSEAGQFTGEKRYRDAAQTLHDAILKNFWQSGALLRTPRADRGTLEDYAYVADGMLVYARMFDSKPDLDFVKELVGAAWKKFFRESAWSISELSLLPMQAGRTAFEDGALPSPSAVLLSTTLTISKQTESKELELKAVDALRRAWPIVLDNAFSYASYVALGEN